MAIRNAKIGDVVYMDGGTGPKCEIISKSEASFGTFYLAKVIDPREHDYLKAGDKVFRRASTFSREAATVFRLSKVNK